MRKYFSYLAAVGLLGCGTVGNGEDVARQGMALSTPTWTPLTSVAPALFNHCVLLTNGDAMCHEYDTNRWHRLRPDVNGSYVNGTWDSPPIAAMPNGTDPGTPGCSVSCTYAPRFFASAVLKDGRVVVIGGEYLNKSQTWTNIGFIYDPVADTWSAQLTEQFGGGNVGDSSGIVLADGTFMLSDISNTDSETLNLMTRTFTALNPTGKADRNDEENWNILYDGTILTVDSSIPAQSETYDPVTNTWGNRLSTVVNMADTSGLGNSTEVGPGVLRPDGTLIAFSGNSLGQNALYDVTANSWSNTSQLDFPLVPGKTFHYAVADGSASLVPNGNVLVAASPVSDVATFQAGVHFYELDLATNTLAAAVDTANVASFKAYQVHLLVLPTGELLMTAYNQGVDLGVPDVQDVAIYSNGGVPDNAWRPTITNVPSKLVPGNTYTLSGTMLNGFSEGASYGDDFQMSTNYPLVRITNQATGHVFYARTHDHSRMGVERVGSTAIRTTQFDVPTGLEPGASSLVVVVNGIPSAPIVVNENHPPVAICQDVAVQAGGTCTVAVPASAINNGSSDPDGDAPNCILAPSGPFGVGTTSVTLSCTDPQGLVGTCNAFVRVGVGNNANCCPAGTNRILGNPNNNVLTGTNGADCILGLGGQDTINGLGGNDIISAGDGDDIVDGGSGNDIIFGGTGQDRLSGGVGNDILSGDDGDDQCFGGDGADALLGGLGQDRLFGENDNDRLTGNAGDDRLEGGNGDDLLDGSGAHDTCLGGAGTDTFLVCQNQTQ
jgi:Ca2+-binding RTX toxin-like protein